MSVRERESDCATAVPDADGEVKNHQEQLRQMLQDLAKGKEKDVEKPLPLMNQVGADSHEGETRAKSNSNPPKTCRRSRSNSSQEPPHLSVSAIVASFHRKNQIVICSVHQDAFQASPLLVVAQNIHI